MTIKQDQTPQWLVEYASTLGHRIDLSTLRKATAGVVAQVYIADLLMAGKRVSWVYRRTPNEDRRMNRVPSIVMTIGERYPHLPDGLDARIHNTSILMSYRFAKGVTPSDNSYARPLAATLARLHTLGGFERVESIYTNIIEEALAATVDTDIEEISLAARRLLAVGRDAVNALLDNRGVATHGDAKAANVVVSVPRIVLIDWDKSCSVSPELDNAIAAFGLPARDHSTSPIGELFQMHHARAVLLDDMQRRAFAVVGDMFIVHDWFVAFSSGSAKRWRYLRRWCLPQWRQWDSWLRSTELRE